MSAKSTFKHPFPEKLDLDKDRVFNFIKNFYMLNRSAVNPDTDKLVEYLHNLLDAKIIEVPAGSERLSWLIPNNWNVRSGVLKTISGEIIVDFKDNPLHLWTHSISFSGLVNRDDLVNNHISTDESRPDEFCYEYRNGYRSDVREWGFSVPYNIVREMTDDNYIVEIDTDLDTNNTLKIVDAFLPGECEETIFIMAHTCHPGIVSDGLGCIAIAIELYYWLKAKKSLKYSYRFIFSLEYFGAIGWLTSVHKSDIDNLKFGIYLDMLTTHEPIGYQFSMHGDSILDYSVKNIFESHFPTCVSKGYRQLWGNDETFYNGPGFNIPTIGVGRSMHREYHYNTDNLENMSIYNTKESFWGLSRLIESFEEDYIPILNYKGPLCLSRHNLYIDPMRDPKGYQDIEHMQNYANGENSCMDIATKINVDFFFVKNFFDKAFDKKLIYKRNRSFKESDMGGSDI